MWPIHNNPNNFQQNETGILNYKISELHKLQADKLLTELTENNTMASTSQVNNEGSSSKNESFEPITKDTNTQPSADSLIELSSDSNDSFKSDGSITDLDELGSSDLSDINVTDLSDINVTDLSDPDDHDIADDEDKDTNIKFPCNFIPQIKSDPIVEPEVVSKPIAEAKPAFEVNVKIDVAEEESNNGDDNDAQELSSDTGSSYTSESSSVEEEPEEEKRQIKKKKLVKPAKKDADGMDVVEILSSESSSSCSSSDDEEESDDDDSLGKEVTTSVKKVVGFITSLVKNTEGDSADDKDKTPHKYFCSQCGKTYSRIFNMKRHERYECGVKGEHVCTGCGKTYSLKRNLSRHEKYECGKKLPKEFICTMCGKTFCRKGSLTRHEQNECGKEPNLQCPYCKHKSKRDDHLFEHIRKCHFSIPTKKKIRRGGNKKSEKKQQEIERRIERNRLKDAARKYGCDRCGKRYTLHRTLRCHEKICGRESNEEHFCSTCNKRFHWKGNLTRHEKFECGKDLFHECLYCPYKTKRTDILSHHQGKCHQNPVNLKEEQNTEIVIQQIQPQEPQPNLIGQQHLNMNTQIMNSLDEDLKTETMLTHPMGCIPCPFAMKAETNHVSHDMIIQSILPNLRLKTEMNELNHC